MKINNWSIVRMEFLILFCRVFSIDNTDLMYEYMGSGYHSVGNVIQVKLEYVFQYRFIESIHSIRKPIISSEISPKIDGFQT